MYALIYTQLGVSPDTQKQTGFAGYPARKDINFSHITVYKKKSPISDGGDCSAANHVNKNHLKITQKLEKKPHFF